MFRWFRQGPSPHQTALAMIGAKAGDRLFVAGGRQPDLAAELGRVAGLNGEVVVAAPTARHAALEQAAERAGALLVLEPWDDGPLPVGDRPFDVCVWTGALGGTDETARRARVDELSRALRPGGRIVIIDDGRTERGVARLPAEAVVALLAGSGTVAARHLATDRHTAYYEARRPR